MGGATEHSTGLEVPTNGTLRRLALAGVAGAIVFWLVVVVLGFVTPGYSVVSDFISTLGEVGAPYAVFQRVNFVILGAGVLSLAVGLHRFSRRNGRPSIAVILLGIMGIGIVGSGIFSANSVDPASTTNVLHDVFGIVGFFAGIIGISLLSRQLDRDERWARHRFTTIGTIVVVVGSFVVFIATTESLWVGLTQRLFILVMTGWVAYHSFRLYQLAGAQ